VSSVAEALSAFAGAGDARYIAGGQSLVPSLSLRLQSPDLLIDISRIEELKGTHVADSRLRIGALTRHVDILNSPEVARFAPLLRQAAAHIGHRAIRNRGTLGGSLAHADPAAEFPAMMLALDAEMEVTGRNGTRRIAADEFFHGLFETAMEPGEILTAVTMPLFGPHDRCAFDELARRRGDFALVGVGVQARFADHTIQSARIAFLSVGPTPVRARGAEAGIAGRLLEPETIALAQAALAQDLDPGDDQQATAAMRRHLARVLLGRVLGRLAEPAGSGAEA
jgi:carbon-monoxide dehydrogenase medium subunit